MNKPVEIVCPACGKDALLRREPLYEGFRRIGERLSCVSCGHVFENEEAVPFREKRKPRLFGAEDMPAQPRVFADEEKPAAVKVFDDAENKRLCRYCDHYVVNPFSQRCARFRKEVEATDTCGLFISKKMNDGKSPS